MIRMLILGYVFAIRSERALCREVQVNLAYRWFCGLEHRGQDPRSFGLLRARATNVSATAIFSAACSSVLWRRVLRQAWSAAKGLRSMRA